MNEPTPDPDLQIAGLARAVRFGFSAIALGLSYPNFRLATQIPRFEQVFHDMLGGKPLPPITMLAIHTHVWLLFLSVLIPIVALVSPFVTRLTRSIYIAATLILIAIVQYTFTSYAMTGPLNSIFSSLSGGGTP